MDWYWLVSLVPAIAIGAGGLGFKSWVGQVGFSVAYGSPPLQRFFGATLLRRYAVNMAPATRNTLWRKSVILLNI